MRLSEMMRLNVNAGWQWDRIVDAHFFSYGVGIDWRTPDNVWTLTAEVFGLVGLGDPRTARQPRYQVGIALAPGRPVLDGPHPRPQHHRRERELDHARDQHPFPAPEKFAGADIALAATPSRNLALCNRPPPPQSRDCPHGTFVATLRRPKNREGSMRKQHVCWPSVH